MIYTVTLNPAVDYIVRLEQLDIGSVNRMETDDKYAGGKGINVSRMLHRLGYPSKATGFIGGFTGQFIKDSLAQEGIETTFVEVDQDTRINVKIKAEQETEINGSGPMVTEEQLQELENILGQLTTEDVVVFSGSAPTNLGNQVYHRLMAVVKESGAEIVCDFEGQTLLDALIYQPLLVKPNHHELAAMFDVVLTGLDDIEDSARKLLAKGAQQVLVSMAGDGALLVTPRASYIAPAIKGRVKNSVGAGDSMVAGFIGEYRQSQDALQALKWGVACGTATAFSDDLASLPLIKEIYEKVEVEIR